MEKELMREVAKEVRESDWYGTMTSFTMPVAGNEIKCLERFQYIFFFWNLIKLINMDLWTIIAKNISDAPSFFSSFQSLIHSNVWLVLICSMHTCIEQFTSIKSKHKLVVHFFLENGILIVIWNEISIRLCH